MTQKTLAMTLPAEVFTLNFFSLVPDLAPPPSVFLARWIMLSEGAVWRTTTSWNTACVKSSDASAEGFTQPAFSVSRKSRKSVLVAKETLWRNNLDFVMISDTEEYKALQVCAE